MNFDYENTSGKPTLIMLIGLAGCGKSTFARKFHGNIAVHSSDALRAEMFGDENDNSRNNELFIELHKRIKNDLRNGKSVVYDATNIKKKLRVAFLRELNMECNKECIVIAETIDTCLKRNAMRERKVPEEAIYRMRKQFQPPWYSEGWDKISLVIGEATEDYTLKRFKERDFDQENEHHRLSLWEHSVAAAEYIATKYPDDSDLFHAAMLHDVGKLDTKTYVNMKGERDGNCHYYDHHCVGAYECMFYLKNMHMPEDEILYISNLIYYHMHPFLQWKNMKESKLARVIVNLGNMYNDIMLLHEADKNAH
jgi:predicted kinase